MTRRPARTLLWYLDRYSWVVNRLHALEWRFEELETTRADGREFCEFRKRRAAEQRLVRRRINWLTRAATSALAGPLCAAAKRWGTDADLVLLGSFFPNFTRYPDGIEQMDLLVARLKAHAMADSAGEISVGGYSRRQDPNHGGAPSRPHDPAQVAPAERVTPVSVNEYDLSRPFPKKIIANALGYSDKRFAFEVEQGNIIRCSRQSFQVRIDRLDAGGRRRLAPVEANAA